MVIQNESIFSNIHELMKKREIICKLIETTIMIGQTVRLRLIALKERIELRMCVARN